MRVSLVSVLMVSVCCLVGCQKQSLAGSAKAPTKRQKRDINKRFTSPKLNVKSWKQRFENPKREVYRLRQKIVAALKLKAGQAVADVGAGTGAFLPSFVKAVGAKGQVYAVDISPKFIGHLKTLGKKKGWKSYAVIKNTTTSIKLPKDSVDLVFARMSGKATPRIDSNQRERI